MSKMKKYLICMALCCLWAAGHAQLSLDRQVFATAGDTARAGSLRLFFTIGEPMTTTLYSLNGTIIVTQGFQQPTKSEALSVEDEFNIHVKYNIFPNPTADILTIELETDKPVELEIGMFDLRGREIGIAAQTLRVIRSEEVDLDLRSVADGVYTLMVKDVGNDRVVKMFKIQKIH